MHEPTALTACAAAFYRSLYTAEPIDPAATAELLAAIPQSASLSSAEQEAIMGKWDDEDIDKALRATPSRSSPGIDGLPYELLRFIFKHSFVKRLFTKVINDALEHQLFPATLQRAIVIFLPKKGYRSQLRNWRPISLICADAKLFTRLMASRIAPFMDTLINPYQACFMRQRFIADNGVAVRLAMDLARQHKLPGIGPLLDQEKAYTEFTHRTYGNASLNSVSRPLRLIV